jgi:hypothetical protein
MNRKISYEDISSDLENRREFSYSIDKEILDSEIVIKKFLVEIDLLLNDKSLNDNEIKLGKALHDIFDNYENIFIGSSNNKFNKNIILLSLREMTNLNTKEIRSSMKKYKNIYHNLIQTMIK